MLPNGHYAKRDRRTGEVLSVKADLKPYKNVIIEREPVRMPTASDSPATVESIKIVPLFPNDRAA
jgi:hypothetical protein